MSDRRIFLDLPICPPSDTKTQTSCCVSLVWLPSVRRTPPDSCTSLRPFRAMPGGKASVVFHDGSV